MTSNAALDQHRTRCPEYVPHAARRPRGNAFTLIELLVVISIIAVLIGILFPVLGAAQRAAKKSSTQALIREVNTACDTFMVDKHQPPGRYSPRTMGQTSGGSAGDNGARGFTTMENALLDLAVKTVPNDSSAPPQTVAQDNHYLEVGPFSGGSAQNVVVDTLAFGNSGGPQYLTLKSEHLYAAPGQVGNVDKVDTNTHALIKGMPDVVDSFGQPLLMWVRDPGAKLPPSTVEDFVALDANAPGVRSNFYWASNIGYLNSGNPSGDPAQYGGLGEDPKQQYSKSRLGGQLIGGDAAKLRSNLAAVIGSPAFPKVDNRSLPAQPRGSIVIVSAGADGVFFGKNVREPAIGDRIGYGPDAVYPNDSYSSGGADQGAITPDDSSNDDIIQSTGG